MPEHRNESPAASPFSALEQLQARQIKALEAENERLRNTLARVVSYPHWVSIGSINSHAELPPISREGFEEIQAVLRGK